MSFDDGSNNVWYDDQGRPHITVTPNAPIGPSANPLPVDVSNLQDYADTLPSPTPNPLPTHWPYVQTTGEKAASLLTGGNGQERYQLFPERIVRSALSLPTDVASGKVQTPVSGGNKVLSSDEDSEDELLQRVQDMAALMGGGGVAMAEKGALGTAGGKLVQDAYHGTPNAGFERFKVPDATTEYMPDRALGVHVTKDPIIANKFAEGTGSKRDAVQNGGVYPVKIPDDKHFLEVDQPLHPYVKDPNTPKRPGNIASDQDAIERLIYSTAFKKDPEILARYLHEARATPKEDALQLAKDMVAGKSVDLPVDGKGWTLDRFMRNFNGKPYNKEDRGAAVNLFKKEMQEQGYVGLKYINTSPMETAGATDPTSYVIFDPSKHIQGKYTNALMSDTTKPGMALAALEKPAPIFHSAVENAVNTASLKTANSEQWLGTISNAKGVKPEELEWTGLKDWLGEQKGPVSKEQVQEYLEGNKVELKEVNKNSAEYSHTRLVEINNRLNDIHNEVDSLAKQPDSAEIAQRKQDLTNEKTNLYQESKRIQVDNSTKYSKYQLPGGENYREKLLTLPSISDKEFKANWKAHTGVDISDATPEQMINLRRSAPANAAGGNYKSSHWDEPNILAHIRMNDRFIHDANGPKDVDPVNFNERNGFKALHIEEIQSDWHQQGREHGYKITDKQKQQLEGIENKLTSKLSEADIGNPDMDAVLKTAIDKKVITAQEASNYKQWSKGENSNIPDAPFKKTWLDLALKRMIREAAEQGKDVLSWTPGEAQAARYDLSKHIKEISHIKNSRTIETGYKGEHTYDVAATDHNGSDVNIPNASKMTERDLENTFGKEIAKKIINDEGVKYRGREFKTLEGLDLKVGGEGMHYFYDKMLPNVLEKLTGQKMKIGSTKGNSANSEYKIEQLDNGRWSVKRNGNVIVDYSTKRLAEKALDDWAPGKQKINYIDIPQSVKDQAMHKGFPLFSSGLMLSPLEKNENPFKRYKLTPVNHDPFKKDEK